MIREVRLQEIPKTAFAFACWELANTISTTLSRNKTYYQKFDWKKNLKQYALKLFLQNPPTKNIQHVGLRGSIGSGKSTAAIAIFHETLDAYPGATILVVRKTFGELKSSVFDAICDFYNRYGVQYTKKEGPPAEISLPNGSKWVFKSSNSAIESTKSDTASGLKSTEYSGCFLEEADTIPIEMVDTVSQRLREPSGVPVRIILYVFNPTRDTHWIYKRFVLKVSERTGERLDNAIDYNELKFTMEDNRANLPPGFIEAMYAEYRQKPALFRRNILGDYGPEVKGDPIYGQHFDRTLHIARESFVNNWVRKQLWKDGPLCLCFDFGKRHPALVVFQDVQFGTFQQIRLLAGWIGDNVTLRNFAGFYLDVIERLFPNAELKCYGDPAGKQRDPRGVSEENAFDVLRTLGLQPTCKRTDESAAIEMIILLMTSIDKHRELGLQPGVVVEPDLQYSQDLMDMLEIGYAQDRETGKFKPVDDDNYIHLADAWRYGMVMRRSLRKLGANAPSPSRDRDYVSMVQSSNGAWELPDMPTFQELLDGTGTFW